MFPAMGFINAINTNPVHASNRIDAVLLDLAILSISILFLYEF
jgi:hypothetical protein